MNVVITGASRGLGFAMAEKFAAHGHNLLLCSQNEILLYKAMESLTTKYPNITIKAKAFDLSDKKRVTEFGKWILSEVEGSGFTKTPGRSRGAMHNSIDVLINNAGQFLPGSVHNEAEGILEKMIEVNLYSAYHLTRLLLPVMMAQKSGHIFNICSIASFQAYPNGGSYSISKFALAGFSKNLREEMKPHGIKVTAVYPGAAYTDSWASSGIDKNRFMEANDIAEMIFAASQLSASACVEDIILRPQLGDI
ncbi:MAG: SDR family oxidoreductase [Bacteroidetes bacterium]|nr:SDR family oxidoreductase [Bacteroidota bacterium]